MKITHYDYKEDRSNNKVTHFLMIDDKKEQLTLFVTEEVKKPNGWLKSGLIFPLHYNEETTQNFLQLLMPMIGARRYKLVNNGHEQIAWFSGFCNG